MAKLESLDRSLFQVLDEEASASLVGGSCTVSGTVTSTPSGSDWSATVSCTIRL